MLIHRAKKESIKYPIQVESIDKGEIVGDNPSGKEYVLPIASARLKDKSIMDIVKRFDTKPLKPIPISKELSQVIMDELELRRKIFTSLTGMDI